MITFKYFKVYLAFSLASWAVECQHLACENRRPDGHIPEKKEGDGGFRIIVVGPQATRGFYTPNEVYTVTIQGLKTRYSTQKLTEFLLVAESEKQAMMGPTGLVTTGIFHIMDDSQTRFSDICPDAVTSLNRQPKGEVSVMWTAPSVLVASCVTFKATVVERPHVWYMDNGQLTKTICPEIPGSKASENVIAPPSVTNTTSANPTRTPKRQRQQQQTTNRYQRFELPQTTPTQVSTTSAPNINNDKCCACDDAKYDVEFEGIWSKETHPKDFPENQWLLHFSDIIGASHAPNFHFWKEGELASEGIRHVAEWGATRNLENELKQNSGQINTIIKARGLWHPNENGKTSAAFRVDRRHPKMSLVSMIGPSPDWFVGVLGVHLCLPDCTWIEEKDLDLYPYDAGTDSGITYMSPNTNTEPREKIRRLTKSYPADPRSPFYDAGPPMAPFAKVHIRRQRIYPKSCSNDTSVTTHEVFVSENTDDDINRPECGVTEWTSWSDCSVTCGKGLRMRKRHYTLPMKADMFRCDRQLVEKEMCLGELATCPPDEDAVLEEVDSICAVSPWTEWSPCSVTCDQGIRTRHRRYKNHMGRKKCTLEMVQSEQCRGPVKDCDPVTPPANIELECPLSPWSEWSPCSVTCGTGIQMRSRVFLPPDDTPLPQKCDRIQLSQRSECQGEYGQECTISKQEAKELCILPPETGPCRGHKLRFHYNAMKGMCTPFTYGGCKGNRNRFDTEEDCNEICSFLSEQPPLIPLQVSSPTTEQQELTTIVTDIPRRVEIFPELSRREEAYSRVVITTATKRTESLPKYPLLPQYPLLVPTVVYEVPRKTIEDTPAATETPTTTTTPSSESEENFNLDLGSSRFQNPRTPEDKETDKQDSEALTFVEEDPLLVIEPVEVSQPGPVDCVVSAWTEWSPCSVTCGVGFKTRSREVLIQPQNDGKRCPRKTHKKKSCQMTPC